MRRWLRSLVFQSVAILLECQCVEPTGTSSVIASNLAWSLEFFVFLMISFPELVRLLDAVYTSWLTIALLSSVVISLKAVYPNWHP